MGDKKTRFPKIKQGQRIELDLKKCPILRLMCCDCGLIHRIAFAIEKNGKLGIAMEREQETTVEKRKRFRSEDKDLCLWPYKNCRFNR